ncbi:hypothetical protein [Megalodesulfovibrio gigas]|uniref:Lipoprotein n=1 Tax=Megalodesulfovibrio gigas (strain ATCC 19364 / DSM 1382 / NCIMB 9332 / VKM B-1759) TaxID=1121448 RepID=T2GAQ5_MEGG1|nr:hypothetical protein [Megalodesulfovibrio gigas]AGW13259.1 hypothetical protein DGI_1413 [Megalodesulfovibrio gigas DSM 1382 = ATCC 19364]
MLLRMKQWNLLVALAVCMGMLMAAQAGAKSAFEMPVTLKASALLPEATRKGPLHTVDEVVHNDGYLNIYTVKSPLGEFKAESTAELLIRIHEIYAMDAMDKLSSSKAFGDALVQGGKDMVGTVAGTITDPLGTITGTFSGVGKMFQRAGDRLAGNGGGKYDDNMAASVSGYAGAKREYAKAFGVDPYTSNEAVQSRLDRLAQAGFMANLTTTAAKAAIPGGVGLAVSAVSGVGTLKDIDVAMPPADMRRANKEKLEKMGVSKEMTEMFIKNEAFTPVQQSLLVAALADMQGVAGRDAFVHFAIPTSDERLAFFRQRMARMYANYHLNVEPLERFEAVGQFIAAKTARGNRLMLFPLDYLLWTPQADNLLRFFTEDGKKVGGKVMELRLGGMASPEAKKQIQALGWKVIELREFMK